MTTNVEETSLVERIVLCCLADAGAVGETPIDTAALRGVVTDRLDDVDAEHVGSVAEADVMRSLNALAESSLVEEHASDDSSPVGKGRLEYAPAVDPATLREALSDDPRVAPLLDD